MCSWRPDIVQISVNMKNKEFMLQFILKLVTMQINSIVKGTRVQLIDCGTCAVDQTLLKIPTVKGLVHQKMKIQLLITHVISNLTFFNEHKR